MYLEKTHILNDDRTLGYAEEGDLNGEPLFLFHGLHSSRLEVNLVSEKMKENHIRLIGIDRAGMGLSTFQENRTLFDTVEDLLSLADFLGIEKFSVIGTSSGAKYALACAHKIPHRLKSVICLSSGVPIEFVNDDMPKVSRIALKVIQKAPWLIKPLFWFSYARLSQKKHQGDTFLANIVLVLDEIDKSFLFDNIEMKEQFLLQCRESYVQGVKGNAYDARFDMLEDAWGFKLEEIKFPHITIYHGTKDNGCPLSMARVLENKIENVSFKSIEGEGHMTLVFRVMDTVIGEVKNN